MPRRTINLDSKKKKKKKKIIGVKSIKQEEYVHIRVSHSGSGVIWQSERELVIIEGDFGSSYLHLRGLSIFCTSKAKTNIYVGAPTCWNSPWTLKVLWPPTGEEDMKILRLRDLNDIVQFTKKKRRISVRGSVCNGCLIHCRLNS